MHYVSISEIRRSIDEIKDTDHEKKIKRVLRENQNKVFCRNEILFCHRKICLL